MLISIITLNLRRKKKKLEEGRSCLTDSTSSSLPWSGVGTGSYPSSAMSGSVALSRSRSLAVPTFSPKINTVVVIIIIIIDLTLRCIFLYLVNSISDI